MARPRLRVCTYIDGRRAIISDDYFDLRLVEGTEFAAPENTTREDTLRVCRAFLRGVAPRRIYNPSVARAIS